jgi:hypothetical protein
MRLLFLDPVSLDDFADEAVEAASDELEVVVGELGPLAFGVTLELSPLAFDLCPIHVELLFDCVTAVQVQYSNDGPATDKKRYESQHEEYEEQDLRDACARRCEAEEPQERGDDGDAEENGSPIQHRSLLSDFTLQRGLVQKTCRLAMGAPPTRAAPRLRRSAKLRHHGERAVRLLRVSPLRAGSVAALP